MQLCTTEEQKIDFIRAAIADHESSDMFKVGEDAGLFYRHVDRQLESIQKIVYDREGNKYEADKNQTNHKLTSNLFFIFCTQLVAYQLGNGISFDNAKVKEQLGGASFDYQVQKALAYAFCDGESYAYVDESGITPLCYACKINGNEPLLVPLKDEDDGEIKAAIRYWRLAPDKPLRVTLYELDGFTEYKEIRDASGNKSELQIYQEKSAYKQKIVSSEVEGVTKTIGENPDRFPIVPLEYINGQSELVGNKATLFAYDVVYSGLVNGVDMNTVYWIIKNADGMSKRDDLNFVADIIHNQTIHEPEDVEIRKEEIHSDYAAFQNVLATLRDKLYTDFMAVDVERKLAGNVTTVEIKAAYQNLNLKCDMIEQYLDKFIRGILKVRGLDENEPFHFKRPNDINVTEFVTMLMQIMPVLGDETTLKLMCETLGLIDEYEAIKEQREAESMEQFTGGQGDNEVIQIITTLEQLIGADKTKAILLEALQRVRNSAENVQNNVQSGSVSE